MADKEKTKKKATSKPSSAAAMSSSATAKKSKVKATPKKAVAGKVVKKKSSKAAVVAKKSEKQPPVKYYEAVGRRKRAIARVRLFTRGDKDFTVNTKPYTKYFPTKELQHIADEALKKMKVTDKFSVSVLVKGGGIAGQAVAVRHGTARALVKFNLDFRKRLKRAGFLMRDPRKVERKKFGLKKARRAPQWSKR